MPGERHPTDVVGDELAAFYAQSTKRLETLVRDALRRGLDPTRVGTPAQRRGDATTAYRTRNLRLAYALIAEIKAKGVAEAAAITERAYASAIIAVDRVTLGHVAGAESAIGRFGGIHQGTMSVLSANLSRSLEKAAEALRTNVETVFARAAALDGAIPPEGIGGVGFIGRRVDDPWRRVTLETIGAGTVSLETRRQVSRALVQRLVDEGVTDATTGFVDAGGRRWSLENYSDMAIRTTTREATSRATVTRLDEHGLDLVSITKHPHKLDVCSPYDGNTYSRSGTDPRYPKLDKLPPFHPRCRHVIGPAAANLDDFEAELERVAGEFAGAQPAPGALLPTLEPPRPPFTPAAAPSTDAGTADRLEAQRIAELIAGDPGPEPGYLEALERHVKTEERKANAALNKALGPELVKYVNRKANVEAGLRRRLLAGEISIDDVDAAAWEEFQARDARKAERDRRAGELGGELRLRSCNCFICGRWKRRPADVCNFCGDDPVSYGGSSTNFNRGYGYAS